MKLPSSGLSASCSNAYSYICLVNRPSHVFEEEGGSLTSSTDKPPRLWAMKNEGTERGARDGELIMDSARLFVTERISPLNNIPSSSRLCVDSFPSSLVFDPYVMIRAVGNLRGSSSRIHMKDVSFPLCLNEPQAWPPKPATAQMLTRKDQFQPQKPMGDRSLLDGVRCVRGAVENSHPSEVSVDCDIRVVIII